MKRSIFILFFIGLSPVLFGNNIDYLNRAIEKLDYEEDIFKYEAEVKVIDKDDITTNIISFNPSRDPKSALIQVDGREPTKADINKYIKKSKQQQGDSTLEDLLGAEYKLISEKDDIAKFSYITSGDIIPKTDSKMNGEIWLNTLNKSIEKIIINIDEKINLAVGVYINNFEMEFLFKRFNEEISVMTDMNISLKGKAVFFEFDQISRSRMYKYTLIN